MFELDPVLEKDTILLASLPLCELLLMNDRQFPWLILVPRRSGARELLELNGEDRKDYTFESNAVSHLLLKSFHAEKLNIAALGNVVAQLHIHHIARFIDDLAWPKPVWGVNDVEPYQEHELQSLQVLIKENFMLPAADQIIWYI